MSFKEKFIEFMDKPSNRFALLAIIIIVAAVAINFIPDKFCTTYSLSLLEPDVDPTLQEKECFRSAEEVNEFNTMLAEKKAERDALLTDNSGFENPYSSFNLSGNLSES